MATPAKTTPAKATPKSESVDTTVDTTPAVNNYNPTTPEVSSSDSNEAPKKPRISEVLSNHAILADFARQYLSVFDEIAKYNEAILAEKNSEWNSTKVFAKARELGNPTDANAKADDNVKSALDKYEEALTAYNKARKDVIDVTSKSLGITLSVGAERNLETEAPLKEKHKFAVAIGTQLSTIAEMLTDAKISEAVTTFLSENPLPAVGRDQVRSFSTNEKSTPKYRVNVVVKDKDGNVKVDEAGFTKASFALTKFYERGKALKSEDLRNAWEKAGNTPDKTVTNPVEFTDNDLHFVITKK